MISMHQAERILLLFAGIAEEHEQRFLERLRQLRRFGVPSGVPRGRGVASGRTFEQMIETALAIRLLEAGLASSDVARLMQKEWGLARSVMILLDPTSAKTKWPDGPPVAAYWIASPAGLASYRSAADDAAGHLSLQTYMLFANDKLQDILAQFRSNGANVAIVLNAGEVVADLATAYASCGVSKDA
jgi:hypothetical protein